MILSCFIALSCVAASLADGYRSYYVPEPQVVNDDYSDGNDYGHHRAREYDHGGHRQLESVQDSHGARDYGSGENEVVRDFAKQAHHNQGAHASVQASGGQENHIQKAHDKGFYEREKKYGYEKAYGYERETKHHDKSNRAQSHGSGYNHNENKGHYNQGGQAVRDFAAQGNKYQHGSDANGNKNILIDLSNDYNRGNDAAAQYNRGHKLRSLNLRRPEPLRRPDPLRTYMPLFLKRNYVNDVDGSLARFRYLSGIHGLGGIRGYGLGYGFNPLRYGGSPQVLNGYDNHEIEYLNEPLEDEDEPTSNVYYIKHEV